MAKKDSDKIIADQAKEISALKAKIAAKEMTASKAMESQVNWAEELIGLQQKYVDSLSESREALNKSNDLSKQISEWQKFMVDNAKQLTSEEKKYAGAQIKNLKNQRDQAKVLSKQLVSSAKIAKIEKQMLPTRKKLVESQQQLNKLQEKYKEPIESSLGFLKDISSTIEEIPIVGGFLNKALGLDTLQETVSEHLSEVFTNTLNPAAAKQAEEAQNALDAYQGQIDSLNGVSDSTEEIANNTEAAAGGVKNMLKSLGPAIGLALALGAAVALFKKALDVDQEVTDMARGFGISREEATEIHEELVGVAKTTKVIGANSEALSAAFSEVANEMGSIKMVSKEMAETQVLLTKQYGLAGEDAAKFQKMANLSGRTAEQNVVAIQGITEKMTGGMMNYKAVMKDVASTSKAVQATFKGNIGQLTKAVVTARQFGKTLDEVKSITDGLLDIEGSIEKEMQARVLTGKDMNFDLARSLKLRGKETEALEEIYKQAGGYDELMKMAPYQLEATADAAGMTVDKLIEGAEKQKLFNDMSKKLGITLDENGKMTEEQMAIAMASTNEEAKKLVLQQQQASAQEKMAAMGDKMSAIFAGIASIMLPIVDATGTIATGIGNGIVKSLEFVKQLWTDIAPYVEGIATTVAIMLVPSLYTAAASMVTMAVTALPTILTSVGAWAVEQGAVAISAAATAIAAISSASALTLGLGAVAIAAGIATAAIAMKSEKSKAESMHDGMIAPDGGLMVSGEKGTYQLHKDDTVVAGTGLGNTSPTLSTSSTTSSDSGANMSELVSLMKQLVSAVSQPAIVKIGNKVVNEIDKIQSMNRSYVGKVDNSYGAV
jgi:hypothetical protein